MKKYFKPTTEVVEAHACMALCGESQLNLGLVNGANPGVDNGGIGTTPPNSAPWRY